MSLAGLKKQLNKANQYVSEKVGGVKGTELDEVRKYVITSEQGGGGHGE